MIAEQLDMGKPLIFEIPNILTEQECNQWIGRIRSTGTEAATINTTRGAQIDAQIRNNRRVIFDNDEWANDLFDRVKDRIPQRKFMAWFWRASTKGFVVMYRKGDKL